MEYSLSRQNLIGWSVLDAFTSSRTIIWAKDIFMFFTQSNIFQILFGGGFAYSYELNSTWTYKIQAHNGFIEILMSTGIVGFLLYIRLLIDFLKKFSAQ